MDLNTEDLQKAIPAYLSAADKAALTKALRDFPQVGKTYPYFLNKNDMDPLQGDIWRGFEIINIENGTRKKVIGMIISNSCDISPENKRFLPPRISFAALIPLKKYHQILLNNGIELARVTKHLEDIRNQNITSIFYIPSGAELQEEHIALFQDVHSLSLANFQASAEKHRLASLNQLAFYLFLFKLSIHFCRFMEGIDRGSVASITQSAVA